MVEKVKIKVIPAQLMEIRKEELITTKKESEGSSTVSSVDEDL